MNMLPLAAYGIIGLAMPKIAVEVDMRQVVELYERDLDSIERLGSVSIAPSSRERMKDFLVDRQKQVAGLGFKALDLDSQVDWLLLDNDIRSRLRVLDIEAQRDAEMAPHLPFQTEILELSDTLRRLEFAGGRASAQTLDAIRKETQSADKAAKELDKGKRPKRSVSARTRRRIDALQEILKDWYEFYEGYDPSFTWWCKKPFEQATAALKAYGETIREDWIGIKPDDKETIIGDPIGREALLAELEFEWIPYSPEELVKIAEREFAWCEAEMLKASKELGHGSDWKAALEQVKQQHVEPGQQPALIKELAFEAIEFLEKNKLITIPPLARESWRMTMLSPAQQLESPFFLGGPTIFVSYPTDSMTNEQKLMSMRGNNRHFARATVHHELIPGHHLQAFMNVRNRPYRSIFHTPFWTEGWALYWEMVLWDKGFAKSPEDRIGMLFWRMHRCARIIFSLNFHLGKMTPEQCIDLLVDKVGHERENAAAEVRRSFAGSYPPLYQIAYMIGGLQFRSLRKEFVDSGKMSEMAFHDRILELNAIPVEAVRLTLLGEKLATTKRKSWKFLD